MGTCVVLPVVVLSVGIAWAEHVSELEGCCIGGLLWPRGAGRGGLEWASARWGGWEQGGARLGC